MRTGPTATSSTTGTRSVRGHHDGNWVHLEVKQTAPLGYGVFAGGWFLDVCPNFPADTSAGYTSDVRPVGQFEAYDSSTGIYYSGPATIACSGQPYQCVGGVAQGSTNFIGAASPAVNLNQNDWLAYTISYRSTVASVGGSGGMTTDQFSAHMYALGLVVFLLAAALVTAWRRGR